MNIEQPDKTQESKHRWVAGCMLGTLLLVSVFCVCLTVVFQQGNKIPDLHIPPPPKPPKPNGYGYFISASSLVPKGKGAGPASSMWKSEEWTTPELQAWYRKAKPALDVIRIGLTYPCLAPSRRSYSPVGKDFFCLREDARTLGSAAYACQRMGNYLEAANYSLDCMEMGAAVANGSNLIANLVSLAAESIGEQQFEEIISHLNSGQLAHVAKRLDRIQALREPYRKVIEEEKWTSLSEEARMLRHSSFRDLLQIQTLGVASGGAGDFWDILHFTLGQKGAILAARRRYFEALEKECERPYIKHSGVKIPGDLLSMIMGDMYSRARASSVYHETGLKIMRAHVALLRYQKATGHFPVKLHELAPTYISAIPADPFGGPKEPPLIYKRTPSGFLLYSLGPDMHNDGGRPQAQKNAGGSRDMVAGALTETIPPPRPIPLTKRKPIY